MSKLMFNGRCYSYGGEPLVQPVIYSEEEREIGCWTDGRPLYAKIIEIASVSFSQSAYNDYYASVTLSSYLNNISTLFVDVTASAYYMSGYPRAFRRWTFDNTNNTPRVELYIEANRSNMPVKLAVRYTKTTDQPGSGTWIPSGALATHYSTDEHVIGTWIDGSTMYEKTIIGTADYDVTGLNVVEIFGSGKTTSGGVVPFPYSYSGDYLLVWIGVYSGTNVLKVATNYTLSELYRTIRYTKSTS